MSVEKGAYYFKPTYKAMQRFGSFPASEACQAVAYGLIYPSDENIEKKESAPSLLEELAHNENSDKIFDALEDFSELNREQDNSSNQIPKRIIALLVGIDSYPDEVPSLRGCVNDVLAFHEYLKERTSRTGEIYDALILTNEKATRNEIINGFNEHLCKATSHDVALFYFSGHGSQQASPPQFWHLEPDRLDETLVCYDSRQEHSWDLADKELSQLIYSVSKREPHIVIILDSCHSGSGTRVLHEDNVGVRLAANDKRCRPISTFIVDPQEIIALQQDSSRALDTKDESWLYLPKGKHVVLSACRDNELAKELAFDGRHRGVFSRYLHDTLYQTGAELTYRDIFKRTNALVRSAVSMQSPQIEATILSDLDTLFLGGGMPVRPYFIVTREQGEWILDAGQIHGIESGIDNERTFLALFPFDQNLNDKINTQDSIGVAEVLRVMPSKSKLTITFNNGALLDIGSTYKAIVTSQPLNALAVSLEGKLDRIDSIKAAISTAGVDSSASLLIRASKTEEASLRLRALDDRYSINRVGDNYPLVVDVPYGPDSARVTVNRLEQIARWLKTVQLTNRMSRLPANAVQLDVFLVNERGEAEWLDTGSEVRLEYQVNVHGDFQEPLFRIRIKNTSLAKLYCVLLDLPESYGIISFLEGGGMWLNPGEEAWANDTDGSFDLTAHIPDSLWKRGLSEIRDTLKLIASTEQVDATLLVQDDLPVDLVTRQIQREVGVRNTGLANNLERLMSRVHTRHIGGKGKTSENIVDWITTELSFTTVRPQGAVVVPPKGKDQLLVNGLKIVGHSHLKARIQLSSLVNATRDLRELSLPPILRNNAQVEPFEFIQSGTRGEPGPSVLEINPIDESTTLNYAAVTVDNPLVLQVSSVVGQNEHILPVAFDGELFIPLGHLSRSDNGNQIVLERLPKPILTRSLSGSIKIFFQKVISEVTGTSYKYPVLAQGIVDKTGIVNYTYDLHLIKQSVEQARKILVCIHGIIGDTKGIMAGTRPNLLEPVVTAGGFADSYDIILTFDYENIHTTIEENARHLKKRLKKIGIGSKPDTTLHIVAHSMGGLVARWFIEREGGNQMVDHLVMLGTPNAGSPWPKVQDLATTAIGVALNGLSSVVWPVKVLGSLISAIETVDVALDQMNPKSEFLKNLSSSPDPRVPYTIIAGRTSIIPMALEGTEGLFARFMKRIVPHIHNLIELALFHQPNDIAVAVDSIYSVPMDRVPRPTLIEPVGCDHMTYFNTQAGLGALLEALSHETAKE